MPRQTSGVPAADTQSIQPVSQPLVQGPSCNASVSADVKAQAMQALNSAFCQHIYSTALHYLRQQSSFEAINQQFVSIHDGDDLHDDMDSSTANHFANLDKNRYRDIVPYDSNRVELPSLSSSSNTIPHNSSTSAKTGAFMRRSSSYSIFDDTYINASFMTDPAVSFNGPNSSSYNSDAKCSSSACQAVSYIATQGPLPNTVADFWRMVAAYDVSAIVMLTELTMVTIGHGPSRAVCAAYFPDRLHDCLHLPGNMTVTCVHQARLSDSLLFRQLEVAFPALPQPGTQAQQQPQPQQQQEQKRLWVNHYKVADWPDHGVPCDTLSVRASSRALDNCRRAGCGIVAHCSAGVGRTGTFIAVDILLQRLHSLTLQPHGSVTDADIRAAVDIPALVAGLRKQRRRTVQTSGQYAFIWQAVIEELQALLQQQEQQHDKTLQLAAASMQQDSQGASKWGGPRAL